MNSLIKFIDGICSIGLVGFYQILILMGFVQLDWWGIEGLALEFENDSAASSRSRIDFSLNLCEYINGILEWPNI